MKKLALLILLLPSLAFGFGMVATSGGVTDTPAFVFTILTEEANDTFTLPIYDGGTYDFNVDWGDSSNSDITSFDDGDNPHTYADAGASTYTITITGTILGWKFANAGDKALFKDLQAWGCLRMGDGGDNFQGCSNMTVSATDKPILTGVVDLSTAFQLCTSLTTIPSLNSWDMSNMTSLYGMFHSCTQFNQDIDGWDVSSVQNFGYMFYSAGTFNQDLNSWDTGSATSMTYMFYNAAAFNGNIVSWDVADVTTFRYMFSGADAFNKAIGAWTTSSLSNIVAMFNGADVFDQDLSNWDVADVTDATSFLNGVTLSTANYNALLIGWAAQSVQADVVFSGGNSVYSAGDATTARGVLTGDPNFWDISDGGQEQ